MPSRPTDRFGRTVGVGLAAAELWFVVSLLVVHWLANVASYAGRPGFEAVLLTGSGSALALAGVFVLARPASGGLRALQLLGSIALLLGGYVITLWLLSSAAGPGTSSAAPELSLFKFAVIGAMVLTGTVLPLLLAPAMLLLLGVVTLLIGPMHGYAIAYDGYASAVTAMVVMITLGTHAARRVTGTVIRRLEVLLDEENARGRLTEAQSQSQIMLQDALLNDLAVLATLEPGPLPPRLGTSLTNTLELLSPPERPADPAEAGRTVASSGVQRAIDDAVSGGLVVHVVGEIATLESLDGMTGEALGEAVEHCLAATIRNGASDEAEITVLSDEDEDEVSIMVVEPDTGTASRGDGEGLRSAVADRIEGVGGSVLVFSRAGVGTTVLLTVPRDSPLVGSER